MSDIIDPLIPPYRFERVQNQLYRGGYPKPRNFRFLRRQRLKTIVSLIPGDQDTLLSEFCSGLGITRIIIPVDSPNENVTVTDTIVSQCLELVTDPTKSPLYLHCLDGSNVTGVIIMCLRKLQLWRIASYQNEYLRFEQDGEIIPEESEFVETYRGTGLVLPNPFVSWLWPGRNSADINMLPFSQGGVHPVVSLVKLRQRMSTDICLPDPLPSLCHSDTDLTSRDTASFETHESSDTASSSAKPAVTATTMHTRQPSQTHRLQSDNPGISDSGLQTLGLYPSALIENRLDSTKSDHPEPIVITATSYCVDEPGGYKLNAHKQQRFSSEAVPEHQEIIPDKATHLLHTSHSTNELSEISSGSRQTEYSESQQSQMLSQGMKQRPLSGIHEVLEPILAALSGATDTTKSKSASVGGFDEYSGDANGPGANVLISACKGSELSVSTKSTNMFSFDRRTPSFVAAAVADADSGTGMIKEVALSYLVQALAIEGLGM
ncbi:tyrosine phosphatase family-domain-containing protein [Kickxella alabastrina]|uniref:tyrosine phosphatase family-domain-containing protein n=1 Tax=Kickxella alabastrina TaxID=61397 RepID=UPI00221E8A99|nr:tyrosine phosphatase family-domain-containing protein [Kickxella alabastrina]KAI7829943.1 tyrosine phosphatase family-domain-containing protein [Kickxella alabastrina]